MKLPLATLLLWPLAPAPVRRDIEGDLEEMGLGGWAAWREVARSVPPLAGAFARRDVARCLPAALVCGPLALAVLDRFWGMVYSAIPLKEDLIRAPLAWVVNLCAITALCLAAGTALRGEGRDESRRLAFWTGVFAAAGIGVLLPVLPAAPEPGVRVLLILFPVAFTVLPAGGVPAKPADRASTDSKESEV
jgi:hypothetical protein